MPVEALRQLFRFENKPNLPPPCSSAKVHEAMTRAPNRMPATRVSLPGSDGTCELLDLAPRVRRRAGVVSLDVV
jgi:hypothetical protein